MWTLCQDLIWQPLKAHTCWPTRDELQQATKGLFALHSQTVQMVCHQFLANVDTARELRQTNRNIRYPYKDKRYYPLLWLYTGRFLAKEERLGGKRLRGGVLAFVVFRFQARLLLGSLIRREGAAGEPGATTPQGGTTQDRRGAQPIRPAASR